MKIEATWLNNVGVAIAVVGTVTPGLGMVYGLASAPSVDNLRTWIVIIGSLVAGVALNRAAYYNLRALE